MKKLHGLLALVSLLGGCDGGAVQQPCDDDSECPTGQYCDTEGCTFICRRDVDCASMGVGLACDAERGRCVPASDGGVGCSPACEGGERCTEDRTCVESTCGDGFVDTARAEECDDGNDVAFDGCESTCTFTCHTDADCDDGNACTGAEPCGTDHDCVAGTPLAEGAACTLSTGGDGVCASDRTCIPAGCGNHTLDSGEECDDGRNGDPADGCKDDCTFSCHGASECGNHDACDGDESCDPTSHRCVAGSPLSCAAADACHSASCSPASGCVDTLVDADGDGHAPRSLGACGDDCDDSSASVSPEAAEAVGDGIDEDCDGTELCYVDADGDHTRSSSTSTVTSSDADCDDAGEALDGPADCNDRDASIHPGATETPGNSTDEDCDGSLLCYVDRDYDGYGSTMTGLVTGAYCNGSPPSGGNYVAQAGDCCDSDSGTNPGMSGGWWTTTRNSCGSFDIDCNGVEELEYGTGACAATGGGCAMIPGFFTPTACGSMGFYVSSCRHECCPTSCTPDVYTETQRCR